MMNPEIKAKWIAALQSGQYTQTQSCLKQGNSFCCLGVLADLYIKENPGAEAKWSPLVEDVPDGQQVFFQAMEGGDDYPVTVQYTEDSELPKPVMRWAGLDSQDPYVRVKNLLVAGLPEGNSSLIALNDDGIEFKVIAQVIEHSL